MTEAAKPLSEQTADALIQYIIDHELKQNDRLPNEKELTELLNVGRSTLREAVRMLASRNILEVRHGAGIFVSGNTGIADDPLGFTFIRDKRKLVADLVEFRLMIEPRIAALAAQNATPEQTEALSALADAVEQRYAEGKPHVKEDAAFHTKLGEMSGNQLPPRHRQRRAGAQPDCRLGRDDIAPHLQPHPAAKKRLRKITNKFPKISICCTAFFTQSHHFA